MTQIPKRIRLPDLTASSIRADIQKGKWTDDLPSERYLSEVLQVSRRTIREAIRILQNEGLIKSKKWQRHQISQKVRPGFVKKLRRMNFLFMEDFRTTRTFDLLYCINEIRAHLQDANYQLEVISAKGLESRRPERLLAQLIKMKPAGAWILYSVPVAVQQWFYRQGIPVILSGTPDASVKFPSLEVDYRLPGYHAANVFLSHGHRKLGCLLPAAVRPGDLSAKAGFEEAVTRHSDAMKVKVEIACYSQGASALCWKLDQLLKNGCTAVLVSEAFYALTAVSYLLRKGVRIPEDISIITLDSGDYLDFFIPDVTRYFCNVPLFARKLTRMALQLCSQGNLPLRTASIIPEFKAGATVARLKRR